jgi:SAM-dependent methyltransferase
MANERTERPRAIDWSGARGEKWRAELGGTEGMLAPVDEPLIDALDLERASRIADVGCGGGGTTLAISRRARAGSVVDGFDISPALVEAARGRVEPEDRAITFRVADVSTAPPPEAPYDRLVSRFGIMFFDEPLKAFSNLSRWLAPNGRFAFAAWARPRENPWFTTVKEVVAEVVELPPTDPEGPGPFRYSEAETLLSLLHDAGFVALEVRDFRAALPMGGGLPAADAARFALAAFSSFGDLLTEAGDGALQRARDLLTERFARHEKGGAVYLDAAVHLFTGAAVADRVRG